MRTKVSASLIVFTAILIYTLTFCEKEESDHEFNIETGYVFNIDETGVSFTATMKNHQYHEVKDFGFVWGPEPDPTIFNHNLVSCYSYPGKDYFEARITYGLKQNKEYYVRAYAVVGINIIYANEIQFSCNGSMMPLIDFFLPDSAIWGDTISIIGKNFSPRIEENEVWFSSKPAEITFSSDTCLKTIIPEEVFQKNSVLTVRSGDLFIRADERFKFASPMVYDIIPSLATWGDTVTITGKNFIFESNRMSISMEGYIVKVLPENDSTAHIIIPESLDVNSSCISIHYVDHVYHSVKKVWLHKPEVMSINRDSAYTGQTILISGKYFGKGLLTVYFNDIGVTIKNEKDTETNPVIPDGLPRGFIDVSVEVAGHRSEEKVGFFNQVPEIAGISPELATYNDTICVYGLDLGTKTDEIVIRFNNVVANAIFAKDTVLKTLVPAGLLEKNSRLFITTRGKQIISEQEFNLKEPEISGFSPMYGTFLEEISIHGRNFNPVLNYNLVKIGDTKITLYSCSATELVGRIPDWLFSEDCTGYVSVTIGEYQVTTTDKFSFKPPVLTGFLPDTAYRGLTKLTLMGSNFNPFREDENIIGFCGYPFHADNVSAHSIEILFNLFTDQEKCEISIEICNKTAISDRKLAIIEPWKQLADFEGGEIFGGTGFSAGDKGYVVGGSAQTSGSGDQVWEYNPSNDSWTRKNDFPGGSVRRPVLMKINDLVYIGPGYGAVSESANTVWLYNTEQDKWEQRASIPGPTGKDYFSFTIGSRGYIGNDLGLWEYDRQKNNWIPRTGPPKEYETGYYFSFGNYGYVGMGYGNGFYRYDPEMDLWSKINSPTTGQYIFCNALVINNRILLIGGQATTTVLKNQISEFFPDENKWKPVMPFMRKISGAFSFTINGIVYYGTGCGQSWNEGTSDFYMLDPEKFPRTTAGIF